MEMIDNIKCYKCQWEDQPMPYTVLFVGANPHASEFSVYNEDCTMHEHTTMPMGPPVWRTMFMVKYDDLPAKVKRDVAKRYKALWKKASTSRPAAG